MFFFYMMRSCMGWTRRYTSWCWMLLGEVVYIRCIIYMNITFSYMHLYCLRLEEDSPTLYISHMMDMLKHKLI